MKATIAAIAVAASLLGGSAIAQDLSLANRTMDVGLSMLELSADVALKKYGFGDQNVMDLTLTQIAAIKRSPRQRLRRQRAQAADRSHPVKLTPA